MQKFRPNLFELISDQTSYRKMCDYLMHRYSLCFFLSFCYLHLLLKLLFSILASWVLAVKTRMHQEVASMTMSVTSDVCSGFNSHLKFGYLSEVWNWDVSKMWPDLRLHLCWRTFALLWGTCLRSASLWCANPRGDSCFLRVYLSNVCWGLIFCFRKIFIF